MSARRQVPTPAAADPVMWVGSMDAFLGRWFTTCDEARAARDAGGGFLLPYRHQFFVATADAVRELGLDPADPDWERIGWDWVRSRDGEAWERLRRRREVAI